MSIDSRRRRGIFIRKIIHAVFSSLLVLPIVVHEYLPMVRPDVCYVIVTFIACMIYVVYFKRTIIFEAFRSQLEILARTFSKIIPQLSNQPIQNLINQLQVSFQKFEMKMRELLDIAQRDYERRYSFVGILMGSIGVLCSYVLFHFYAIYGIMGLAIYDTVSAVSGAIYGRHRLPFSIVTFEGCLTGMLAYYISLLVAGVGPIYALVISLVAVLSEAYGVEDNLSIPIFTSLAAYLLLR
ncbi:MAG: phosphatidate cytidylyltransferase [Crenarchaeota archaeon]|nr:phosphatidate cytidylyltransferase [Thermoproteota archaeon]